MHTTIYLKGKISEANPSAHVAVVLDVRINFVPGMVVWCEVYVC